MELIMALVALLAIAGILAAIFIPKDYPKRKEDDQCGKQ